MGILPTLPVLEVAINDYLGGSLPEIAMLIPDKSITVDSSGYVHSMVRCRVILQVYEGLLYRFGKRVKRTDMPRIKDYRINIRYHRA